MAERTEDFTSLAPEKAEAIRALEIIRGSVPEKTGHPGDIHAYLEHRGQLPIIRWQQMMKDRVAMLEASVDPHTLDEMIMSLLDAMITPPQKVRSDADLTSSAMFDERINSYWIDMRYLMKNEFLVATLNAPDDEEFKLRFPDLITRSKLRGYIWRDVDSYFSNRAKSLIAAVRAGERIPESLRLLIMNLLVLNYGEQKDFFEYLARGAQRFNHIHFRSFFGGYAGSMVGLICSGSQPKIQWLIDDGILPQPRKRSQKLINAATKMLYIVSQGKIHPSNITTTEQARQFLLEQGLTVDEVDRLAVESDYDTDSEESDYTGESNEFDQTES